MIRIDLHCHTTASDGSLSPSELVMLAKSSGLYAVGISDHDTVSGYEDAKAAGEKAGIEVVPAIELGTRYKGSVHILGYYIDTKNPDLISALDGIVIDRDERNRKIVSIMNDDGIEITYGELKARFGEVIGRPHIAEILVEHGMAKDTEDAFKRLVGKGMHYWLPRSTVPIERCIELIRNAGGIPVLAHPFEYRYNEKSLSELIEYCIDCGIMGIECRHSSHTPGEMAYLELLADEYGLLKTGGSDFHGDSKPDINLGTGSGTVCVPYSWLEEIKKKV